MSLSARAIPITSKEKLLEVIEGIKSYPNKSERDEFTSTFGGAVEDWFYQEIDGRPFVIAVIEGAAFDAGFDQYATSEQPYFLWFHQQILDLTGVDMRKVPGGAAAEHIFRFSPDLD